ncbi:lactose ABC transporter permease, partial [Fischerella thermalis WC213]
MTSQKSTLKLTSKNWIFINQQLTPYLFLLPALVILVLTVFWPALQAFYLSFTRYEYDLTQTPTWIGFANFRRLWVDPVFW